MTNFIMILAIAITAIATGVIAYYAKVNHQLASTIQSRDDEFRQQIRDLYRGIIISNFLDPEHLPVSTRGAEVIKSFNRLYDEVREGPGLFENPSINK